MNPQSQSQPQQNQWSNKDNQEKRYKQGKAITKGILDVWQTQRATRKKGFSGGYLAEVNITLGIDLINGGYFLKP